MPVPSRARVNAGPPTRGNSIVLSSRPPAGRSGRCVPSLCSPLRNLGNSFCAIAQSRKLATAQTKKIHVKNIIGIVYSPIRNDELEHLHVETQYPQYL